MTSLLLSTLAFFVASFFIRRSLDDLGIPPGMTRNVTVFTAALAISYGVAFVVDHLLS
jgi:hypothetical protein